MGGFLSWRMRGGMARTWLTRRGGVIIAGYILLMPAVASVNFNEEVRPLLSSRCYPCHGPDEESRKAKLRLDLPGDAVREKDGLWPIKPGSSAESEVMARITTRDAVDIMPPTKAGEPLTTEEIDLIRRWIEEGAVYAEHWAWVKPERPVVPVVESSTWPRNEVDPFILARQVEEGLRPSVEADAYALARRLTMDLTGLPPTFEQIALLDGGDDEIGYERLVAELLASPRFGEHWARLWMDLARYADSAGYGSDPLRPNLWPWRDWVIEALNRNMPYDQFTVEQLAGDLLPGATEDQIVATGFHRNTMTNTEGGTDDEEYRVAAVKDRANTTAQVWMGLTMGCAQCHTHKFDPISHREYYRFFAFFNQTEDNDQPDERPTLPRPTAAEALRMEELKNRITALEDRRGQNSPELDADLAVWEDEQRLGSDWRALSPDAWRSQRGSEIERIEGGLRLRGVAGVDSYELAMPIHLTNATALRFEMLPERPPADESAPGDERPVRLTEVAIALRAPGAKAPHPRYVRVELPGPRRVLSVAEVQVLGQGTNLARAGIASQSSTEGEADPARAMDGSIEGDFAAGSVAETRPQDDPWWEVDLGAEQPVDSIAIWNRTDGGLGTRMTDFKVVALDAKREQVWSKSVGTAPNPVVEFRLPAETKWVLENASTRFPSKDRPVAQAIDGSLDAKNGWGGGSTNHQAESAIFEVRGGATIEPGSRLFVQLTWSGEGEWGIDALRLSTTAQPPPVRELPERIRDILEVELEQRTAAQVDEMRDYIRGFAPAKAEINRKLREARNELAQIRPVAVPVMRELPADRRRGTRILHKGNFLDPGDVVEPGVPESFHAWPEEAITNRLGLARWLVSKDNPLTARVAVNRLWARLFGTGLVETEEDFGTQGNLPSHPELLDWLAVEFMEGGWDMKSMLRLLVTSATYRQSAVLTPELWEKDPRNRWLARASRLRLDAEAVRDQALALAGLLSPKLGGPSVFPPQPEGLWRAAFNGERDYPTSSGEDRYRRGLYVFLRRTVPNPTLAMFDAPSRETCTFRRLPTNTPLQAFVTLNDPVFVEAARGLAQRILREGGGDLDEQVGYALRLCLGRPPTVAQEEIVMRHFEQELAHYGQNLESARALIAEPTDSGMAGAAVAEMAAWTSVANVLLNLDALMNRG